MHSTLRACKNDTRSMKVTGRHPRSLEMLAKLRPRNKHTPIEASSLAEVPRRVRLNFDAKLDMLQTLDRSTLDNVQGANRDYRKTVSDKMNDVCLRGIWTLTIEFLQESNEYRATAEALEPVARRVELTVPMAELSVTLIGLLKNGALAARMKLCDVVISQQFLDAVRPALNELYVDPTAALSLDQVTCSVRHGHAQLIDVLAALEAIDMHNMGDFQPADLDDAFFRSCLANGCRAIWFPLRRAAPHITDESIFELCFGIDPNHRPQRSLRIEGPTLSATFVRDFVRRYLACTYDVGIDIYITVTPPPQLFEEVEKYRAEDAGANGLGGFEFHVSKPPSFILIRWLPVLGGRLTIQRLPLGIMF